VIMFLRTGFVVGQAGISGAIGILLLCEILVVLTAISLSAVATNTAVRGGGAYFLISRVLGPEFGGAIGLALFLAQALSVPFYILGFTEAMVDTFPDLGPHFRAVGLVTALALFAINRIGARWAIKSQYLVMTILGASVLSFLGGALVRFDPQLFHANWTPAYTDGVHHFWSILAIFFPAVTGIMAGINMSGDLKNPARSLVRGTFAAIGVGFVIYLLQMVLCGGSQTRVQLLTGPYTTLLHNALLGSAYLVVAGVFSATLSSAVGSYLGAPRVLQALARDHIFKGLRPFAVGSKKGDEPVRGLWLTLVLTVGVLFAASGENSGDAFNSVAALVAEFFLCTYGMVNLAAFVESVGANPSFRPSFRFYHWSTALLGLLGCLGVMVLVDYRSAFVAVLIIAALYFRISRLVVRTTYGDARRGFVYSALTKNLMRLRELPLHAKNWRPTILVLSGHPEDRLALVKYSTWLEAGRGIISVIHMLSGKLEEMAERRAAALERLNLFVRENELNVFPEAVVSTSFDEGIRVLLQSYSIGPIKPNLVTMGWPSEPARFQPFMRHLRDIQLLGMSGVVVMDRGLPDPVMPKRIDLWWRGKENGSLMIILAHLMTSNWDWRNARVRILRVVEDEAGRQPAREALIGLMGSARIEGDVVIVVSQEPFSSILWQHSREATLVMLGFNPPDVESAQAFAENIEHLTAELPTTMLVNSSGEADLLA